MRILMIFLVSLGLTSASAFAELSTIETNAAREGNLEVLKAALTPGSQINDKDDDGYSLLILAVYHHQITTADWLLHQGADPNLSDGHGRTALMGAAFKGDIDAVKVLVADPRTNVNLQNHAGQTAAMYASLFGQQDILEYLVQQGADLNIKDGRGNTVESLAESQGADKIVAWVQALKG
ncbi:MAG: ankyrin repeat domain-containing protein [Scandinavium sp.]|uniref:ankyrin repeat domain-containing protein n=1 Tax=Scandinavium sp. TaxID=2830653 RepID=UPI003F3E417C